MKDCPTCTGAPPIHSYAAHFRRNVIFGWSSQILRIGLAFFLVGYQIRKLDPHQWGLVILANSIVAMLAMLQLGAAAGLAKRLNTYLSQEKEDFFQRYFVASVVFCVSIAGIICFCVLCLATAAWSWTQVTPSYSLEGRWVLLFTGLASACSILTYPYTACLGALHRIDVNAKWNMFAQVFRLTAIVVVFECVVVNAWVCALTLLLARLSVLLGQRWWVRGHLPLARWNRALFSISDLRSVVGFNLLTMFNALNYTLFMQSPVFLLQRLSGLAVVGLYGIALQLNVLVSAFAMIPSRSFAPMIVSLVARGDVCRTRHAYAVMCKAYLLAAVLCGVGLTVWGPSALTAWVGDSAHGLLPAIPWVAITLAGTVAGMPSAECLVALERLRLTGASGLILIGVACIAMWFSISGDPSTDLLHVFQIVGGAYAAYQGVRIGVVMVALCFSVRELLARWIVPLVTTAACTSAIPAVIWDQEWGVTTVAYWAALGCTLLVWAGLGLFLVYDSRERNMILTKLRFERKP